MIRGGIKSNSVPESIRLTCDVRTLPHQDEAYVRQELDKILEGIPGVEIDIDYMSIPNSSPFETEFAERIRVSTARAFERDDIQWVPSLSTGFTDSRFTRNLGTTTYGMVGSHTRRRPDAGLHPRHQRVGGHPEPDQRHSHHGGAGLRHPGRKVGVAA